MELPYNASIDAAFHNAAKTGMFIAGAANRQVSHIYDLARCLLTDPETGEEKPAMTGNPLLSEAFLREYRSCCEALSYCEAPVRGEAPDGEVKSAAEADIDDGAGAYPLFSLISQLSRLRLCEFICRIRRERGHALPLSVFFGGETEAAADSVSTRIAYVRNYYSDTAYRVFSHHIKGAGVVYPGSFSAVCEEVYYNRAEYCILPYETSDEGVLPGFRMLIDKYELVPVLTCPVVTDNSDSGSRITHFMLLSKNFTRIKPSERFDRGSEEFLKITLDNPDGGVMAAVLSAALSSGLAHVKTESVPVSWEDSRYSCSVVFSIRRSRSGGEPDPIRLAAFLLYLALEIPESAPGGIYSSVLPYPEM